ncbi:MAG: family 16 glycoside hydrolase [Cyclobacteriaceae bacterium]
MKKLVAALLFLGYVCNAQKITPNLQNKKLWHLSGRSIENFQEQGKTGVKFSEEQGIGMLILDESKFSMGTIEFDVKGKDVPQQSFVGVAFHIQNDSTYDAIYFRPFNFLNADTTRRVRAIQYISMPKYDWPKLRAEFPSKYENRVNPVPNPEKWFHVKVVVNNNRISVFVNDNSKPCLVVDKLAQTKTGKVGLWVGNGSGGSFANLVILPSK